MELANPKPPAKPGLKTLILYWSATGNTEKVALAIQRGVRKEGITPTVKRFAEAQGEDFCRYDLVFMGAPPYHNHLPPLEVQRFLSQKEKFYMRRGDIKLGAPRIPGKTAVVFCTYSGPHTGVNEAIPTTKYMGQFLDHLGFDIAAEWHIVGESHDSVEYSTKGRLGDIRGRPNEQDLAKVEADTAELVRSILTIKFSPDHHGTR